MKTLLERYFKTHKTLCIAEAKNIGISRAMLSYLCSRGELERLSWGVYAPIGEIPDELLIISLKSENIIFSHETALALHKLHNRIPAIPSFTIPTGSRVPRSLDHAATVYYIPRRLHGLGRTQVPDFQGNEVVCYDIERTICDIIRSRSRMDVETYVGSVRSYVTSPKRNLPVLFKYAKEMGIEAKVHNVMEVLV